MKKKIIKITAPVLIVFITIIWLTACAPPKKLYVGYVCNFAQYEWDLKVSQGAAKRADEVGINIEIGDSSLNAEKQTTFALTFLEKGVDVLVISPIDETPLTEIMEEAKARNVPVITDTIYVEGAQVCVGIDNKDAGKKAGEWFAKQSTQATFLLLSYPEQQECIDRINGFKEGYNSIKPINIGAEVQGLPSFESGKEEGIASYQENNGINAVFGINDDCTYGAVEGLKEAGALNISAVGFGMLGKKSEDMLLNSEEVIAELAVFPEYIGATLVDVAVGIKKGEDYKEYLYTPTTIITKENIKDFYTEVEGKLTVNFNAVKALNEDINQQ